MLKLAMLPLLTSLATGQLRPTNQHPTNLDFSEGEVGQLPTGWNMPKFVLDAGYRAELRREGCGGRFSSCIVYSAPASIENVRAAEVAQTFPAGPYLRKSIHFGAWLRLQGSGGGNVELRMRVDHANGKTDFFDSVAAPVVTAEWQRREVIGGVSADAVSITIWARYHPSGSAWVANPSFEVIESRWSSADEKNVRALITQFAERRNEHNGASVAALYSEDGEWIGLNESSVVRGRQALQILWNGIDGQVQRTIESVTFPGDNIAVVAVTTQYGPPIGRHHETFVVVKENGAWFIRVHQTLK
jgi:uncharacterized protein (TIGR02246 family)